MNGESYEERDACPVYTSIGVISGRWKPMLLQRLHRRPHGFGELRRAIPSISTKVLREQLRQLEADDLVVKRQLSPRVKGVRYSLTAHGHSLDPVFSMLWEWGTRHLRRPGGSGTRIAPPGTAEPAGASLAD
jgi:DNA-binding HxlR family transcriptional regulator